jgi:serine/threonine protein kinase
MEISADFEPFGFRAAGAGKTLDRLEPRDLQNVRATQGIARTVYTFENRPTDTFTVEKEIGKGSYGTVYNVRDKKGNVSALKVIVVEDDDLEKRKRHFLQAVEEAVVNILLFKESAQRSHGPYVQELYEVGCVEEEDKTTIYLRVEYLDKTLGQMLSGHSQAFNDRFVPSMLMNLAAILAFFKERLQMNHRDLKSDNIMFVKKKGKWSMRLIDFGLTCLSYKGAYLSMSRVFSMDAAGCAKPSRDLSLLLLELLLDYRPYFSAALQAELETLAMTRVDSPPLAFRLNQFAPAAGFHDWENAYAFLNRTNVSSQATFENVRARMGAFLKKRLPQPRHSPHNTPNKTRRQRRPTARRGITRHRR